MSTIKKFEELVIWQNARKLINEIYKEMNGIKDFGFKDQIQRASVSIMNNIAEGFERYSDTEFRRFLDISKASCGEVRSMLYLAEDLHYLNNNTAENAIKYFAKWRRLVSGRVAESGVNDFCLFLTISQTCERKGISFLNFLLSKEKNIDKITGHLKLL